jgi:1,4-alpha-glucan branching enzyme
MTTFTRLGAAAVAGAALFLGFFSRGAVSTEQAPMAVSTPTTGEMPVAYASNEGGAESALVQTQFVFEETAARTVSLVGDFNQWKAGETPLVRLANGLWTTTVPLPAGRHVYAFMIDDTLLVADPRAPKAGDADFGREGSVVMVFTR